METHSGTYHLRVAAKIKGVHIRDTLRTEPRLLEVLQVFVE